MLDVRIRDHEIGLFRQIVRPIMLLMCDLGWVCIPPISFNIAHGGLLQFHGNREFSNPTTHLDLLIGVSSFYLQHMPNKELD